MPLSIASLARADVDETTGIAGFIRDQLVRTISGFSEVDRAVIYGSRARGDFARYSDIDIALYSDRVSMSDVARIKDALDDSFIVFPVDITAVSKLPVNSSMRRTIDRDGITIYDRASDSSPATAR